MKKQYFILSAIVTLTSCGQEAELEQVEKTVGPNITTINASTSSETRAKVNSEDNKQVIWETGDAIGVLGKNATSQDKNLSYSLSSDAGTTGGTFVNAESDITAVSAIMYPYQSTATFSEGTLTCIIPSVQTATANSFDKNAAVMYALGNSVDADLAFAVNFLKVTVSDADNVHSITVRSNTKLTGSVSITSAEVATTEASVNYVTLSAAGTAALAAGSYYIAVAQTSSIEKPTFIYKYTNGTLAEKTASSNLSFAAGKNVKPVSINFSTGTVHRGVQLWDNGPYFATCNVGATSPEDYGDYFAWGETMPYYADGHSQDNPCSTWRTIEGRTITGYNWGSYKYSKEGRYNTLTKYCGKSEYGNNSFTDDKTTLEAVDDAATANWGEAWRMPTNAEQLNLRTKCYWLWVTSYNNNTIRGYVVYRVKDTADMGKKSYSNPTLSKTYSVESDVHIFLPASGFRSDASLSSDAGFNGYYWLSSLYESSPYNACHLLFNNGSVSDKDYNRCGGQSVRPVCASSE